MSYELDEFLLRIHIRVIYPYPYTETVYKGLYYYMYGSHIM